MQLQSVSISAKSASAAWHARAQGCSSYSAADAVGTSPAGTMKDLEGCSALSVPLHYFPTALTPVQLLCCCHQCLLHGRHAGSICAVAVLLLLVPAAHSDEALGACRRPLLGFCC